MHPDGILFGGEGRDQITNAGVERERRAEDLVFVSPLVLSMCCGTERRFEGRNGFSQVAVEC